jgi:hypothetical protein
MKQMLIDMMAAMMPFMKTPVLIGGGVAAAGFLLLLWRLFTGRGPFLGYLAWILIALGGFYLACQAMGMYLGMQPTINFGDPRKFEFRTVEFWKVGAVFLGSGLAFLAAVKLRKA